MYERMLDKQHQPSFDELAEYCGDSKDLFKQINDYLINEIGTDSLIRFPYGNSYGWGLKYSIKRKHICDIFAEKEAFTIMLRLTNIQFDQVYNNLTDYTKEYIDNKYPCGEGGWIHYRVLEGQHLNDIKELLQVKIRK